MKFEDLKGLLSSNQTGAFPHISARKKRYIMVMEDSNAGPILATVIKSRHNEHLLEEFKETHDTLTKASINPILQKIDNKFSKELIEEIVFPITLPTSQFPILPEGNYPSLLLEYKQKHY